MTLILLVTKSIALKFTRLPMPQSKTRRTKNDGKALAVVHIFWSSKLDDTVHRRYPSPVDIRNISWFLNCIQTYSNIITDGSYPSTTPGLPAPKKAITTATLHMDSRWINRVPWRCCRFLDISVSKISVHGFHLYISSRFDVLKMANGKTYCSCFMPSECQSKKKHQSDLHKSSCNGLHDFRSRPWQWCCH